MSIDTKKLRESVSGTIVTASGKRFREMIFSIADHIDTIEAENKALTLAAEIEAERGDRLAAIADRLEGALKSMGQALGFEGANTGAPLDAQAAEIAALRQPWQPIETAPKDGTWIVAWRGAAGTGHHDPMIIVRWHQFDTDDEGGWSWPDSPYDVWTDSGRQRADTHVEEGEAYFVEDSSGEPFTHWMPLPAPPAALSGESNG